MFLDIVYILGGLVALIWSADKFIDGASDVASYFGMSPLMVGMIIVGFGTSAPEMVVSAFAAINGSPGIAIGNAYGSNIVNISLVLAFTLILYPVAVNSRIVRREVPLLIIVLLVSYGFFHDNFLSRVESIIMVLLAIVITVFSTFYGGKNDSLEEGFEQQVNNVEKTDSIAKSVFWLFLGLAVLLISSNYLVEGAVNIAKAFGVSELVIGLTIIAIGTSLPELAASIVAIKKGESDIVLGNIIGSCLFNTLGVVGIAGVISPYKISSEFLSRDYITALGLVVILWIFMFGIKKKVVMAKKEGLILLGCYFVYVAYLLFSISN